MRRFVFGSTLLLVGCAPADAPGPAPPWAEVLRLARLDARGARREAVTALDATPRPDLEALLDEPPPWPPASVQRMRGEAGGPALIGSLVAQIAADPGDRAWLLAEWAESPRPVDDALFARLADARGGRLHANPRLRAWLRAEWTAWLEQRYRRVARRAVAP